MTIPRRRITPLKLFVAAITFPAVLALALWIWIESVASRRWAALEMRVGELARESVSVDPARPAIGEPVVQGNAWEAYREAAELLRVLGTDGGSAESYLRGDASARPAAERDVKVAAAALDHVRSGARHAAAQYPHPWWLAGDQESPFIPAVVDLVHLAACRALLDLEGGDAKSAARWTLVTLQLVRDLGHNGTEMTYELSIGLFSARLEELAVLLRSEPFRRAALDGLAEGLERLDAGFPRIDHVMTHQLLMMGRGMLRVRGKVLAGGESPGWRDAYSTRIALSKAFEVHDRGYLRYRNGASWGEEQEARVSLIRDLHQERPVETGFQRIFHTGKGRQVLAQLRLLRASVALRREGTVPALEDPFGGALRFEEGKESVRIWSAGANGIDDGGHGRFTVSRPLPGRPPFPPDLVLEIPK